MKEEIYYLPDYLVGDSSTEVWIHFYRNDKASVKNKVVFTQNMVCLLLEGSKEVFNSLHHKKIDAQEILFFSAGTVLMSESLVEQRDFESILLFFTPKFMLDFCLKHQLNFQKQEVDLSIFSLQKDAFLKNFEASLKCLQHTATQALYLLKIEELFLYLLSKYPSEQLSGFFYHCLRDATAYQLEQVVAANADKNLTIEELAFLCNMSSATFKRRFSEAFQSSPKRYFTEIKMQKAKQLLQLNKSATEIYSTLGYESLSSFSNEFKKHFGQSPKQFQDAFLAL